MNEYKGYKVDQYNTVYDCDGYAVGKLINETLQKWVEDFLERLE